MTERTRWLFLDLEDSVITPVMNGWFNTEVINATKVKTFIAEFKPDYVNIFSFAIWNEKEKKQFELGAKPMLEQALGITLSYVPTVDDDILPSCLKVMGITSNTTDFADMSAFWGKQEAFRLNVRHIFKSGRVPVEVVLLDDAVFNENFEWPNLQVKGRVLNIDQLYADCQHPAPYDSTEHLADLVDRHTCGYCGKIRIEKPR